MARNNKDVLRRSEYGNEGETDHVITASWEFAGV
jgi:hypothetical protein